MLFGRLHRGAISTVVVPVEILVLTDVVASPPSESYPNHLPLHVLGVGTPYAMSRQRRADATGQPDIMFSYSGLGT